MMIQIPDVLSGQPLQECRKLLAEARWQDGRMTAGHLAVRVKRNRQLAHDDPLCARLGNVVLDALGAQPLFMSAALPLKVLPPRFNRYEGGEDYGDHIDSSVLTVPGTNVRIRTDISATLFFSEPAEYDGGELVINDTYRTHHVKLPAGHLVLYPGTSLHRVTPVTRGARIASFFWIQSLVRDDTQRSILFRLDGAIQSLAARTPDANELGALLGVYHNLLRQWSST